MTDRRLWGDAGRVVEAIVQAAQLLPAQGPLRTFVHHNTLHPFEHLPFDKAVIAAATTYGAQPYLAEQVFAKHLATGRIRSVDLDAVMPDDDTPLPGNLTRRQFRRLRLQHAFEIPQGPALDWLLAEGDALRRCHEQVGPAARARLFSSANGWSGTRPADQEAPLLQDLWQLFANIAPLTATEPVGSRPRDRLLAATGVDTDDLVHPLLIRLCAAFIDQGIAYWPMPWRERGLLGAFRALYGQPQGPPDLWLQDLPAALQRQAGWGAIDTILAMLAEMEVAPADWTSCLQATLLSLRGWAGMIHQLEHRPDRAPVHAPPARLADYLAVQLTLDVLAARYVWQQQGTKANPTTLPGQPTKNLALAYEAFVMAQIAGLSPADLAPPDASIWLQEVQAFDSLTRRRLLHHAYERRHRIGILDGLLAHAKHGGATTTRPRAQVVFCIDDREESLRRHLEEVYPDVETHGYAGFFGIPMAYLGLDDIRPQALCPVSIRPRHLVVEEAIEPDQHRVVAVQRRLKGQVRHAAQIGSRTLVRGSLLAAGSGLSAMIPLVARTLFPRLADRLMTGVSRRTVPRPATRLRFERPAGYEPSDTPGLLPGFTVAEMAELVAGVLATLGIDGRLAPLVVIVGHGSSSLNNPHEAAYDCGATGGGRGGPNARTFALMANHPEVRRRLQEQGRPIPEGTWFIGAYHDTSTSAVSYYDLAEVPTRLHPELARLQGAVEKARRRDAHERCRRFASASAYVSKAAALAHVEGRAVDLAQPRPEIGHATNAVCFVGRRSRTRGLYLDRRAFLVSYDPERDPSGQILGDLLTSVGPVGAGINLEYYFSHVDSARYGCGTKLPHNIVGLLGVMDGHASDLRTGLPWQMVELHEPVRLLTVVEAEPATLAQVLDERPGLARLIRNHWIHLVAWSPSSGRMHLYDGDGFVAYEPESDHLPTVTHSIDHYRGRRDHLGMVRIRAGLQEVDP